MRPAERPAERGAGALGRWGAGAAVGAPAGALAGALADYWKVPLETWREMDFIQETICASRRWSML